MGTGPDRYKLNSKRPLDPLQLTPRKRLQQGEQADSGGPRIVTIVERLENLESNYSAQTAHIAGQTARIEELEKLVSALQEGIFGRAQNITRPREGECGPEGPRVGTSGATVVRLPSVPAPRSDGLAGGKRNSPIEVEDEDSEDGLYSASVLPTPPYTPALTTTQPPPPKLKMPHPICNLRAIHHTLQIPDPPNETFSYNFLQNLLGGHYISDGYHEIGKNSRPKFRSITSWYTLSLEREPYAPSAPGHHGAKLSVFMRQHNFAGGEYAYYGSYREPRISDRLDYSRMVDEVPRLVKEYWAKYLTSAARRWSTDHFIEMNLIEMAAVTIDGSIDYDLADRLARKVKAEDILKAFEAPDADEEEPSMRLYWEYLECVEWDDNLYKGLKMEKRSRAII